MNHTYMRRIKIELEGDCNRNEIKDYIGRKKMIQRCFMDLFQAWKPINDFG